MKPTFEELIVKRHEKTQTITDLNFQLSVLKDEAEQTIAETRSELNEAREEVRRGQQAHAELKSQSLRASLEEQQELQRTVRQEIDRTTQAEAQLKNALSEQNLLRKMKTDSERELTAKAFEDIRAVKAQATHDAAELRRALLEAESAAITRARDEERRRRDD